MKATFLSEGGVRLLDVPLPKVGEGEILVKMMACGVCGTDIEKVKGVHVTPPVLGHEAAGEVVERGEGAGQLEVGERVFVHHHVSCGNCHYCLRGSPTMCGQYPLTNLDPCGFAEYFRVPKENVRRGAIIRLPAEISCEEATFIEPLACCIRGLARCGFQPGDDVVVVGAGPAGLLHIELLRALGSGLIVASDVIDFRLMAAKRLGADLLVSPERESLAAKVKEATENRGADIAIVASGSPKAISDGLRAIRKGGVVSIFGAPYRGTTLPIDMSSLFIREASIIPSYSTTEAETSRALKLVRSRAIDVMALVTHRFKLDSVSDALSLAAEGKDCLKVMINP